MTSPHEPPPPDFGCEAARAGGRAFRRRQLPEDARLAVERHLSTCPACRELFAAEATWDTALDEHLPRFAAPASLKSSLAASWGLATEKVSSSSRATVAARPRAAWQNARAWVGGACLGALVAVAGLLAARGAKPPSLAENAVVVEAVNDHLRVIQSSHPVEIESGGIHQVKPWFTGKLDFAPGVAFSGDDEFPLVGGSVGYFIDRKAAVLTFKHRLHVLTLLVVPRQGLPWPTDTVATSRGFHLRLWRRDDLGYVLVSDASAETVAALARHLDGP